MGEMTEDPREAKLPAWARQLLHDLRRQTREAERLAERASLSTSPETSGALLDRFDDHLIGLGEDPRIAFRVPFEGYRPESSFIEVRRMHDGAGIYVHATDEIICRQQSINAVRIVPWPKNKRTGE